MTQFISFYRFFFSFLSSLYHESSSFSFLCAIALFFIFVILFYQFVLFLIHPPLPFSTYLCLFHSSVQLRLCHSSSPLRPFSSLQPFLFRTFFFACLTSRCSSFSHPLLITSLLFLLLHTSLQLFDLYTLPPFHFHSGILRHSSSSSTMHSVSSDTPPTTLRSRVS